MIYDVAIVGAGPAGSWLARELSKNNKSVILFERATEIGDPNFSSAGSPYYIKQKFDIPEDSIAATWNIFKIVGPTHDVSWSYPETKGLVLDFRKFKKNFIEQAQLFGTVTKLGTSVKKIIEGVPAILVTEKDEEYAAKIIVDSSGSTGVLAKQLGLRKSIPGAPSIGIEIICEILDVPKDQNKTIEIYLGKTWAPHGYAWIFPMGINRFKFGICAYHISDYDKNYNLDSALNNFISQIPWAKKYNVIEKHGGLIYGQGGIKNHIQNNVIIIGDAADQVNPLGGEGIRHALQSAMFASEVIIKSLDTGNTAILKEYNKLWSKYIGRKWLYSTWISKIAYHSYTDPVLDSFFEKAKKLTPNEAFEIIFEYNFLYKLKSFLMHRKLWAPRQ